MTLTTMRLAVISALALVVVAPRPVHGQDEASTNRVIDRLRLDLPAIGTFTRTPRPDLDFVVFDTEYGTFDIDAVSATLRAMRTGGAPPAAAPIVRIPYEARDAPDAVVAQLLDAGALGVMFPDIETRAQAVAAVDAMQFDRSVAGGNRVAGPSGDLVAMLQIESPAGIAQLDAILDVPGIGAIFLGPTDLATAIGATGPNAPQVEALVQQVLRACLAKDIPCGYPIVARSREEADRETARRLAEGFTVLAVMTVSR